MELEKLKQVISAPVAVTPSIADHTARAKRSASTPSASTRIIKKTKQDHPPEEMNIFAPIIDRKIIPKKNSKTPFVTIPTSTPKIQKLKQEQPSEELDLIQLSDTDLFEVENVGTPFIFLFVLALFVLSF